MKNITLTPKKIVLAALYAGLLFGLVVAGLKIYHEFKYHSSRYTPLLPISSTPEAFISNFYSLYNKDDSTHAKLVKNYTTSDFQKKYAGAKNSDLLLCGNKPTPTFNVAKAYKNTVNDNNTVYNLNLVYPSYGSQNSVFVDVDNSGHSYLIKDVICTSEGRDLLPH